MKRRLEKSPRGLNVIDRLIRQVMADSPYILKNILQDASVDKGKRLRARLFLEFSGTADSGSAKIAAAIELLHIATLIHDDVIDRSLLRRKKAALHTVWGVPVSVLAGDYIFSKSFLLLSEGRDRRIWHEVTRALSEVIIGEISQQLRRGDLSMRRDEYLTLIGKKTGDLFGVACKIGAMRRRPQRISPETAYRFGKLIGTAYQMLDDCGDYLLRQREKTKLLDIQNGIVTLPLIILKERCPEEAGTFLKRVLKKQEISLGDISKLRSLMRSYGVLPECVREIKDCIELASRLMTEGSFARCGSVVLSFIDHEVARLCLG